MKESNQARHLERGDADGDAGRLKDACTRRRGALAASWATGLAATLLSASPAAAQPAKDPETGTRRNWPCPGCITFVPPSYSPDKPVPLLVGLHGDGGSTDLVLRMWKTPTEQRGYILTALRCPRDLGCDSSFWRWHGDPAWIMAQVDAIEAAYSIDPSRIYLSGWSGGSTYMSLIAPLLSPRFAAINLNGGGVPPPSSMCAACKMPVYYFVGAKNPLFSHTQGTRDHFRRCGHELVWDVGPGLDHPAELQAIFAGPVAERVVAWLDTKRNACIEPKAGAPADAGADGGGPEAGIPLDANETSASVELTNDTAGNQGAGVAAGAPFAASSGPPSSVPAPPRSRPAPGGCGCRPAASARGSGEERGRGDPLLPAGTAPMLAALILALARRLARAS